MNYALKVKSEGKVVTLSLAHIIAIEPMEGVEHQTLIVMNGGRTYPCADTPQQIEALLTGKMKIQSVPE